MKRVITVALLSLVLGACGSSGQNGGRGIADKRSDFSKFLPMSADPTRDGLKPVEPFFRRADRTEILRAVQKACAGGEHKRGSSVYNEARHAGYYVNCNPENRQLLNGYVSANAREAPRSR